MTGEQLGTTATFGVDEMRGVAADIGALLDRLEAAHGAHCVLAALQLVALRRSHEHQLTQALCDTLTDVAALAFQNEPVTAKN